MTILEELLNGQIIKDSGCWEWRYTRTPRGYGILSEKVKPWASWSAHRLSAMIWLNGFDINNSKQHVLHTCDNSPCYNPEHLFIGTSKDNQLDCVNKGRNKQLQKTHCPKGHEFTKENIYRRWDKPTSRGCFICRRLSTQISNEKKRTTKNNL